MNALYLTWSVFSLLTGLVLGSFANVAISRWAVDQSVIHPRSHCPYCGTTLTARDLVPVLSWLALRGRCRTCESPIPANHPLIELLGGMLGLLVFWRIVPGPSYVDLPHLAAWGFVYVFVLLLLIAAFVDLRHWLIPDQTSIYAIPFGFAASGVLTALGYTGWMYVDPASSVAGALVGAGTLATASLVARFVRGQESLGWGDVKLMGFIGAFVGPLPVLFIVLMLGSFVGAVFGLGHLAITRRGGMLPFGPSLVIAAIAHVLYGDVLARALVPGIAVSLGWM